MEYIHFLADPSTIYEGNVILKSNILSINFETTPSKEYICTGIELLNKYNGEIEGHYEEYNTIYRQYDDNPLLIEFSCDGSIWVEPEPPVPVPEPEPYVPSLDEVKQSKIYELESECENTIYRGTDVTFNDGSVKHFSLTIKDQLNLFGKLSQIMSGKQELEYHADGEPCIYYNSTDMQTIINTAMEFVEYHRTYCNALNMWCKGCTSKEEVATITYGVEIPEKYQSEVMKSYAMNNTN